MPTLVVEDGSGLSNANSFLSRAEADTLADESADGEGWGFADADVKDRALITATREINAGFDWFGRKRSPAQALEWPRIGMIDRSGYPIASNIIPASLRHAVALLARNLVAAVESGAIGGSAEQAVSSVTLGSISVKFAETASSSSSSSSSPVSTSAVSAQLRHLGVPVGRGARTGRLVR